MSLYAQYPGSAPSLYTTNQGGSALPDGAYPFRDRKLMFDDGKTLLSRIRLTSGISDDLFQKTIIPLVENYADFVQTLPASRAEHHFRPEGMWHYSLEVALLSLQTADSKIFTGFDPVELRHVNEPRWRMAAFCAGLLLDAGITISRMRVFEPTGKTWEPLLTPLKAWGESTKAPYYFVQWLPDNPQLPSESYRMFSGILVNRLLAPELLAYLAEGGRAIIHELILATSGLATNHGQNTLLQIVEKARSASIEREIKSRAGIGPSGTVGVPVEAYLLDGLRSLTRDRWGVNKPGSPIWMTNEGLFVCWHIAAPILVAHLTGQYVIGLPREANTLAEILISQRIAVAPPPRRPHDMYWDIDIPEYGHACALKLATPEVLFGDEIPTTVEIRVTTNAVCNAATPESVKNAEPPSAPVSIARKNDVEEPGTPLKGMDTNSTAKQVPARKQAYDRDQSNLTMPEALASLRKNGKAGEIMAALAEDCAQGRKKTGLDIFWMGAGLAVVFPQALTGYGFDPVKALAAIRDKGWLVHSQKNSKSLLHDVSSSGGMTTQAMVLAPAISKILAAAAGIDSPDKPVQRTKSDNESKSPAEKFRPKNFFESLTNAAMQGVLPFKLQISGAGIQAPYPQVLDWYSREPGGVGLTVSSEVLNSGEYVTPQGSPGTAQNGTGGNVIVFRRDYCQELYIWLKKQEKFDETEMTTTHDAQS